MGLRQELDAQRARFFASAPADEAEIIRRTDAALAAQGIERRIPRQGDPAPPFALPNVHGRTIDSASLLAKGPLIVVFYRGGWCPYCNLELRAYQRALPDIRARGAALVAISPETPDGALSAKEKNGLEFEVLSDGGNKAAAAFGLVHDAPMELRALYAKWKLDLPRFNGQPGDWNLPLPGTFVISPAGAILLAHADADYRIRLEPSDALAALDRATETPRRTASR
jgi:peroxiredoxin